MEKYTIKICISEEALTIYREMLNVVLNTKSCTAEELAECKQTLEFFNSLPKKVEVSTLEEYFSLIETIHDYTEGDYILYNGGRRIELY